MRSGDYTSKVPLRFPRQPDSSFVEFLGEELCRKDLWLMVLGSALMSVAFLLRSGAKDNMYWRIP